MRNGHLPTYNAIDFILQLIQELRSTFSRGGHVYTRKVNVLGDVWFCWVGMHWTRTSISCIKDLYYEVYGVMRLLEWTVRLVSRFASAVQFALARRCHARAESLNLMQRPPEHKALSQIDLLLFVLHHFLLHHVWTYTSGNALVFSSLLLHLLCGFLASCFGPVSDCARLSCDFDSVCSHAIHLAFPLAGSPAIHSVGAYNSSRI